MGEIVREDKGLRFTISAKEDGSFPDVSSLLSFLQRDAPNLIWPADKTWFVVSEVDFDSTLVGGSGKLIEAIVESSELEAWQMEPGDSLLADADRLNVPREGNP
jgi:hypothetical protein